MYIRFKRKRLNEFYTPACLCGNCDEKHIFYVQFFVKYFAIYLIPVLPLGKRFTAQCANCEYTYTLSKNLPSALKKEIHRLKRYATTPIWLYAFPIIIGLLMPLAIYRSNIHENKEEKWLKQPMVGDIYFYKLGSHQYTSYKVARIKEDSILFLANLEVNKKVFNSLGKTADIYFGNDTVTLSKTQVKAKYDNGEFHQLIRN